MIIDSKIRLADLHCHLDLYPDFEEAVIAAEQAGVFTLAATTTPRAWPRNRQLTRGLNFVHAALGLHPQLAKERKDEIKIWERYLPEARFIGEVGLDGGPRYFKSLPIQKQIFEVVLRRCAESGGKVLTVHSTRCASTVLDMIEELLPPDRGRAILHWFGGSPLEVRRAAELGCYFSINVEMARNERGRRTIEAIPNGRILTETDGPFTQVEGRPSCPSDVALAVSAIAAISKVSPVVAENLVSANLRNLMESIGD